MVIPFAGSQTELEELISRARDIRLGPGDSVTVVDNRLEGRMPEISDDEYLRVTAARDRPGSYLARNRGAAEGSGGWLLFIDADVDPPAHLLDLYFATEPEPSTAVLIGAVEDEPVAAGRSSAVARFLLEHSSMSQENTSPGPWGYAQTANCAIRRSAFEDIGGFREDLRSAGDADICFRLRAAGWGFEQRQGARVTHRSRTTLRGLVRQRARHGSGGGWLQRAYPGSSPPSPVPGLVRWSCRETVRAGAKLLRGDRRAAAAIALDPVSSWAFELGRLIPNQIPTPTRNATGLRLGVITDQFPARSETFVTNEVAELRRLGATVLVEATSRPSEPDPGCPATATSYLEDEPVRAKPLALAQLLVRHPLGCLMDVVARRRWRRDEPVRPLRALAPRARRLREAGIGHMHVHFAAGAALDTMRLARIEGIPYSVTAHAYEIFESPANLRDKLRRAAFVTTGCEYNARHLRGVLGEDAGALIHVQVMGVDLETFKRTTPYPGGRNAIGIGRLVEKKGFTHLLDAVAELERREPLERLTIVGDGHLRGELTERITTLGLEHRVELVGALGSPEIRDLLERADVLVMPAVIAANGDRDSMPVVVKEAMAMELPVVVSDEVGLPELVDSEVGRLAAPGDPVALAGAIEEVLQLPAAERVELGRAGRQRVIERCDLSRETGKLTDWIVGEANQVVSSSR